MAVVRVIRVVSVILIAGFVPILLLASFLPFRLAFFYEVDGEFRDLLPGFLPKCRELCDRTMYSIVPKPRTDALVELIFCTLRFPIQTDLVTPVERVGDGMI